MPVMILLLAFAAALVFGLSGIPMLWDGSYLLFETLNNQSPFIALGRVPMVLFEFPVVVASKFTDDLGLLRATFGLSYGAVPFLSLALSWLAVRSRAPHLMVWPALSILGVTVFAQLFTVNEGLLVAELTWPLWLLAATASGRTAGALLLVGAVALLRLHPTGLIAVGVATLIVAARDRRLALALGSLVLVQIITPKDPYEIAMLTGAKAGDGIALTFFRSVVGLPGVSAALLWLVGLSLILPKFGKASRASRQFARFAPMPLMALSIGLTILWAADRQRWATFYDLRLWVLILSLPLAGMMFWESRRTMLPDSLPPRRLIANAVGVCFLVVLSVQGLVVHEDTERLRAEVLASTAPPCSIEQTIPWLTQSPLYSWSMPAYSMLLQGRAPRSVILGFWAGECAAPGFSREIPISSDAAWARDDAGWFDLRQTGLAH